MTGVQPLLQDDGSPAPEISTETEKSMQRSWPKLKIVLRTYQRLATLIFLAGAIALVLLFTATLRLGLVLAQYSSQDSLNPGPRFVRPAPYSDFLVGSIIGQPPQTRYYNFVVSELPGAPDGVEKQMLVVNGENLVKPHGLPS